MQDLIFKKLKINEMELDNRIIFAALSLEMAKEGHVTDDIVKFYEMRARNGSGLIIIGGASVHPTGKFGKAGLYIFDDSYITGLRKLNDAIHSHGVKTALQLYHPGKFSHPFFIKQDPISSSAIPVSAHFSRSKDSPKPVEMSLPLIDEVIQAFVQAGVRAKKAGFDAVEIHSANGFLIDQFLSPAVNKRNDLYGGTLLNRMRFLLEIIKGIRESTDVGFSIIVKLNGHDLLEGGNTLAQHIEIAQNVEKAGANAIHLAPGSYESKTNSIIMHVPRGTHFYLSKRIKEHVNIPVIISERFGYADNIYECLINNCADAISVCRSLICDPGFVTKIKTGQDADVKTCISCNQGCYETLLEMKPLTCMQNPNVMDKFQVKIPETKKKVVIIGAGPAGLEAAKVLKERGHTVKVFEKTSFVGGNVRKCSLVYGQSEFNSLIDNYLYDIKRLEIDVQFNCTVEKADDIASENADAIIVATGSRPQSMEIPGIENTVNADDIITGKVKPGRNIIIIGGGPIACETALFLVKKGAMNPEQFYYNLKNKILTLDEALEASLKNNRKVTVLGRRKNLAAGLPRSRKLTLMNELNECNVELYTRTDVKEIIANATDYTVKAELKEKEDETGSFTYRTQEFEADMVVNAGGYEPEDALYERLGHHFNEIYKIGDAKSVRDCIDAIREGFEIGHFI